VVFREVVIATGVTSDGGREALGLDVGDSEDGAFWTAFLRSLKASGLAGVQLVISDAHTGLKAAISAGHGRHRLAAMPGSTSSVMCSLGCQGLGRDGRCGHPHDLRPAHHH
jgi:Transposase, Mutator family